MADIATQPEDIVAQPKAEHAVSEANDVVMGGTEDENVAPKEPEQNGADTAPLKTEGQHREVPSPGGQAAEQYDDADGEGEGEEEEEEDELDNIDLENADPQTLARHRAMLIQKRRQLIDQLKQEKIDAGEPIDEAFFAALYGEIEQQLQEVGDVGPIPGTLVDFADGKRKRGRPRKYPRAPDGTILVSPDLKSSKKRGRPPKKRKIGELEVDDDDVLYDDSEGYSLRKSTLLNSASKRVRPAWSIDENRLLLRIFEAGIMDPQAVFEEMNKDPNNRKSADHIRNKRSTLNTRALARAVELVEVLRDDIAKQEAGIDDDAVMMDDGDIPPPIATTLGASGNIPPPIATTHIGTGTRGGRRPGRPKKGNARDEDAYGDTREPKRRLNVRTTPAGSVPGAAVAALRAQITRVETDTLYVKRALERIMRQNSKIIAKLGIEDEPEIEEFNGMSSASAMAMGHDAPAAINVQTPNEPRESDMEVDRAEQQPTGADAEIDQGEDNGETDQGDQGDHGGEQGDQGDQGDQQDDEEVTDDEGAPSTV